MSSRPNRTPPLALYTDDYLAVPPLPCATELELMQRQAIRERKLAEPIAYPLGHDGHDALITRHQAPRTFCLSNLPDRIDCGVAEYSHPGGAIRGFLFGLLAIGLMVAACFAFIAVRKIY